MPKPEALKRQILAKYSVDTLKRMFASRGNDKLFYEVGEYFFAKDVYSNLKREEFHIIAWTGKDYLIDFVPYSA